MIIMVKKENKIILKQCLYLTGIKLVLFWSWLQYIKKHMINPEATTKNITKNSMVKKKSTSGLKWYAKNVSLHKNKK